MGMRLCYILDIAKLMIAEFRGIEKYIILTKQYNLCLEEESDELE